MTAIELKPIEQKTSLDILYNFETDELNKVSNHLYEFPEHTNSLIQLKDKVFKPIKLYLTPKLHNGKHSNELIVETVRDTHHNTNTNSHKTDKLFMCFTLSSSSGSYHTSLTFPMKTSPLEELVNMYGSTNLFYTTRNRHPVIVCPTVIRVGNDFPMLNSTAKKVYKEIFEPNDFHILSSIITLQDNNPRTIEAGTNVVHFQKQLLSIVEGFHIPKDVSGDYMECEALADDGQTPKGEFIITPLKTKADASLFGIIFFMFLLLGMIVLPLFNINFMYGIKPYSFSLANVLHLLFGLGFLIALIIVIISKSKMKKMKKKMGHVPRQKRQSASSKEKNSKNIYNQYARHKHFYRDSLISLVVFLGLYVGELIGLMILCSSNYKDKNDNTYNIEIKTSYFFIPYNSVQRKPPS